MKLSKPRIYNLNRRVKTRVLFLIAAFFFFCFLPQKSYGFWHFGKKSETEKKSESSLGDGGISSADSLQQRVADQANALQENLLHSNFQQARLPHGVIVCSFVDLKKLHRTSSFGRYLAEQFMNAFQQNGFRVVELRKTRSIIIENNHGEYGLSRDDELIEPEVSVSALVVGTYMSAGNEVVVNARIVDGRDGALLSTAAATFLKDPLVTVLLKDSSSAAMGKEIVTYMKRLEP